MNDGRRNPRNRTLKAGKVVFQGGFCSFDCVIRDMSATGARLRFSEPVMLPERIELILVMENRRFAARPVWHRGVEVGLQFV